MRPSIILSTAWAALTSSQCFSSIPQCAQSCMTDAATQSTSCGASDWTCQCTTTNEQTILDNAENCVDAACGESMWLEVVKPAAEAFCKAIDGGQTCSSSTTSSGATSTTLTSTTTGTVPTTSGTRTGTGTGTGTATATATAATSSSTAGAAVAAPIGSFGMMVLGALALV